MAAGEAFGFIARQRIDEALTGFEQQTGIVPSVYVGATDGSGARDVGSFADQALSELPATDAGVLLIVVDPGRRQTVIRTDATARLRISDETCGLATLSMTTSFGAGDLVGGIVVGLRMLGDSAAPPRLEHDRPPPTASTATPPLIAP